MDGLALAVGVVAVADGVALAETLALVVCGAALVVTLARGTGATLVAAGTGAMVCRTTACVGCTILVGVGRGALVVWCAAGAVTAVDGW
jgi:hypothetical protein